MLREIYMWLNGYFMSATVDIHCPPPLSTAVIIIRSHPPRCLPPSESSATIIVCRSRHRPSCAAAVVICHVCILSSNICLGPVTRHSSFLTPSVGTQFKGTLSAVIKVMLTSSSAVRHSAHQGIEHERTLSNYYISPFIHIFVSTFAFPTFAFYN